jgi:nucleotide-binding universal stress UspA family protein
VWSDDHRRAVAAAYDLTDEAADGLALGRLLAGLTGESLEVFRVLRDGGGDDHDAMRERRLAFRATRQGVVAALGTFDGDLLTLDHRSIDVAMLQVASRQDVGLLVLGSTHRGRLGRLVWGMGAEYVVPHAACPVALAPPGFREQGDLEPSVVGVAYDGTESAQAALDLGASLAAAAAATLRIVSVRADGLRGAMPGHADPPDAESLEGLRRSTAAAHPTLTVTAQLRHGDPVSVLVQETAEVGLMVAGAHRHRAVRRIFLGTVATALVRRAQAPVIIVPSR